MLALGDQAGQQGPPASSSTAKASRSCRENHDKSQRDCHLLVHLAADDGYPSCTI